MYKSRCWRESNASAAAAAAMMILYTPHAYICVQVAGWLFVEISDDDGDEVLLGIVVVVAYTCALIETQEGEFAYYLIGAGSAGEELSVDEEYMLIYADFVHTYIYTQPILISRNCREDYFPPHRHYDIYVFSPILAEKSLCAYRIISNIYFGSLHYDGLYATNENYRSASIRTAYLRRALRLPTR